jgi:hypothetical protein
MNLIKPTIWASVVFAVPSLLFLWLGWQEMNSPDWGTDDSGAVQGFAFFAISILASFLCVLLVFPGVAKLLGQNFTPRKWIYSNIGAVVSVALISAIIFWALLGDSSLAGFFINALVLSVPLSIISLVLLTPAMYIWLRIARFTHNKANQQGPAAGTR